MNEILREEVENRLKLSIDDADYLRNDIFKKIEKIKELNKKFDIEVDLNSFTKIANYRLFLNLLISDISSAILFYLNSKSKYEQIYSVRLIIVCINEGYKKIYQLFCIPKILKNESNSQLNIVALAVINGCFVSQRY